MRKGIALIITITLLATFSILILENLSVSQKYSSDMEELLQIYQTNKIVLDSKEILKETLKDVNDTESLEFIFQQPFPISSEDLSLTFLFSSEDDRININNLIKSGKVNEPLENILENILISYNIADSQFFLNLLLDTIDTDDKERVYASEIKNYEEYFQDGGVYNLEHFNQILDYYVKNKNDKSVYTIPWNIYIGFNGNQIDINFASLKLLSFLIPSKNIDIAFKNKYYENYDELNLDEEAINTLKKVDARFDTDIINIEVLYSTNKAMRTFKYIYSLKSQKFSSIKYLF